MASKNVITQIPITIKELAAEIQKIQDGNHIIFLDMDVTAQYFQNILPKNGINAEFSEIKETLDTLIKNEIINFEFAIEGDDTSNCRMTFKKPDQSIEKKQLEIQFIYYLI